MKLGLRLPSERSAHDALSLVSRAEALGFDSVWVGESYGRDAVSTLGYLAARTERIGIGSSILQIDARRPAMAAMAAATIDELSGGRLRIGLGVSGPQVVEGWYGVPFSRPLRRTREYVTIVRDVLERQRPVRHTGEIFQLPNAGSTVGKPLRLSFRPERTRVPILLAAMGPKNIALAAEIADGWIPIFFSPAHADLLCEPVRRRLAAAAAETAPPFEIVAGTQVACGPDLAACRDRMRPRLAFYIGEMGAHGRNFYFDLICRYGYRHAAERIAHLAAAGDRRGAAAAVPDSLVDATMLVGPRGHIRDQLCAWASSPVTTLVIRTDNPDDLDLVRQEFAA